MKNYAKVILQPKKDRSLRLFHPWVFSGAIAKEIGDPKEGEIVEVFSSEKEYLATGHFHEGSIKVRLFSFTQTDCGEEFWFSKFKKAYDNRERLGLIGNRVTNIYRLIHAEGDGMPGLIIDIYGAVAVIQTHTVGMHEQKNHFVSALKKLYGTSLEAIFDKSSETMSKQNSVQMENSFLFGSISESEVFENDIKFYVNWVEGQKTGFFIDQRENRKLLSTYAKDKKVLNTFSYSGGFSMYALAAGATEVHSVDSSKKAGELAVRNAELNDAANRHQFHAMDAFDFLKTTKDQYDIVILDPPAFAKHLSSVDKATVGYRNLNTEGFYKVKPGGLLFTFSCSQVIDKILFRKIVFQAAAQSKRNVRILYQLTQGPDHAISIYHPEGEYLKGLVLQVD
jgi:23S rRNA (cytosine1962-C5)-methyltransferase